MIRHRIAAGRLIAALGLALVLCIVSRTGAFADTAIAAPAVPRIDFSPFVSQIIEITITIFGPAIGMGLAGIVFRIFKLLGVKTTDARNIAIRGTIDHTLDKAITYARNKVPPAGGLAISVPSSIVATAAGYALEVIPDTLKDLGIVDEASERLAAMVEARLAPPAA